ncbi:MAG: SCO family protein [Phycisphaerae bacterium]
MNKCSTSRLALIATLFLGSGLAFASANSTSHQGRGSRWGRSYFPNVPLITHEGKQVRFFDDLIKDKVVMINFIYTSCPDTCPLETARLGEVQRILGDRVGKDVFMYSITIDPEVDTPEVLKAYTEKYKIGPGWTFLTGDEADITILRKRLGLYIAEIQNGSNDHNLSLIIGNQATGRWKKSSPFENPYVLAAQVGDWLTNFKLPSRNASSYQDAPELRQISKGERLFRTRCTACHNIGKGDGQTKVGPNLAGVVKRRDPTWLIRWLKEPEKMLAEQDPIATGLFIAYNYVPMPNMRLSRTEVHRLIEYIDTESQRVEREEQVAAASKETSGAPKPCCKKRKSLTLSAGKTPEPKPEPKATKPCCKKMQALMAEERDAPDSDDATSIVASDEPEKKSEAPNLVATSVLDVNTNDRPESNVRTGQVAAPPSQRTGLFRMSMIFSFGLGCALFVLAAVLRRSPLVEH